MLRAALAKKRKRYVCSMYRLSNQSSRRASRCCLAAAVATAVAAAGSAGIPADTLAEPGSVFRFFRGWILPK